MKKICFLALLTGMALLTSSPVVPQNVPNGDLEAWEVNNTGGFEPVGWESLNSDDFTNVFQVEGHSGQHAANLSVEWDSSLEMYIAPMFSIDGNFSISERFTALEFYLKGTIQGDDYFSVSIGMFKQGVMIGFGLHQLTQTFDDWTKVTAAITYDNTREIPDECFIGIHIYPVMGATFGTYYMIDDLELTMGSGPVTPALVSAITNVDGNIFELTFNTPMANPAGMHTQFSGTHNGSNITFTSASLKPGDDFTILLNLADPVTANEDLTVSYEAGTVTSAAGIPLGSFSNRTVINYVGGGQGAWQIIPSGTNENLYSVHFADNNKGFIGGAATTCLKSANGGLNWSGIAMASAADFRAVWATTANDVYLGAWDTIYHSHNSGQSWVGAYTNSFTYWVNDLQFLNSSDGFAFMPASAFIKTTDGGNTWSQMSGSGIIEDYLAGCMIDQSTGFAVGHCGLIAETTDGGTIWNTYEWNGYTEWSCININGVHFTSSTNGIAVADSGVVFRTTNGGDYWSRSVIAGENDNLNDVWFVNANQGWAVGNNGKIFSTTDGGATWIPEIMVTPNNLNSVFFSSAKLGWAVGDNGTILRFGGPTGTSFHKPVISDSDLLIYPNPTNGKATLLLDVPMEISLDIELTNLLGVTFKPIFTGKLSCAKHQFEFDVTGLPNGLYFCKVTYFEGTISKPLVINK